MTAAANALGWLRQRGVKVLLDGAELVLLDGPELSPKMVERLRELKPLIIEELSCHQSQEQPAGPKVRKCVACSSIAFHGVGAMPWKGVEGRWYCAEHVPPRDTSQAPPTAQDNRPATTQPMQRNGVLELRNIVTGETTIIDLHANDTPQCIERASIKPRDTHVINAQRRSVDFHDYSFDLEQLQRAANERNAGSEALKETSRFCRCGQLASTQWRLDGKLVWFCDECF